MGTPGLGSPFFYRFAWLALSVVLLVGDNREENEVPGRRRPQKVSKECLHLLTLMT